MDLRLSAEQQQLVDTFAGLYAKEASSDRVRAAEPLGFDKALWEHLSDLGVVTMAVPDAAGGWGASLLDLALIAEQQGRFVAPAPVIETQVTARMLASVGAPDDGAMTTLALHPVVDGVARLVPAAAVAERAVVSAGADLIVVPLADDNRVAVENLGAMPVADVSVGDGKVIAHGPGASAAWHRAIDEYAVLTAAAVVGMAARALELTTAYVADRQAWGKPIGSYQGVAHRLADAATAVDGARLLAYEAAWAADEEPERSAELAAMAFGFAAEAARDTTYWAVHLHGGYGFMLEFDVQLFYRRCRAWARVLAAPSTAYGWVADHRYGAP